LPKTLQEPCSYAYQKACPSGRAFLFSTLSPIIKHAANPTDRAAVLTTQASADHLKRLFTLYLHRVLQQLYNTIINTIT
jgi:hypothetical protein